VQLDQQFTIPIDIEKAWSGLLDITRVAAAFPGATLATHTDDSFTGTVKVKLGPVSLTYRGEATFTEIDEAGRRVAIVASGSDVKGNGTASADVRAALSEGPDSTTICHLKTNLEITGKAAQFGRGIVVDIGNRVLSQFAANLEQSFREPTPEPEPAAAAPAAPVPLRAATPAAPVRAACDQDSLDALDLLWGSPAGRRGVVGAGALLLVLLLLVVRRRTAASS
jgi:uncharacterized protein